MPDPNHTLGLPGGKVLLVDYNEAWPRLFEKEKLRLKKALGRKALRIEHVGSTAVENLSAKPVLDIAVAVRSLRNMQRLITPLKKLGYRYKGEFGLPGREFFVRGDPATHHLHVVLKTSEHWKVWLLFRDYLRAHPREARRYERFKRNKARRFADDRPAYTRSKARIVEDILKKARAGR